jgi:hypothetical protein
MFALHNARKTIAASLAAAAVAGGLTLAGLLSTAPAAEAASPIVKTGDILLPTFGTLFTGGGVDKLDPVTRVRSRAASFGINDGTDNVAAAPNGDFFVGSQDGRVRKVDAATGAQTTIKFPFIQRGVAISDLVVGADGKPIGLINEETGQSLVRFEGQNAMTVLSEDGLLGTGDEIALEYNGQVLVTAGSALLRITPSTGEQEQVTAFSTKATGVAVRGDSTILVRTAGNASTPPRLVKINRATGAKTTISSGGFLDGDYGSEGLAMENGTHVISAEGGGFEPADVVRINTFTGNQDRLIRVGEFDAQNIAVAGVNQIPPAPLPKASNDTFTMAPEPGTSGELHVLAPGVLANDRDPVLGQKISAELVSQPSHGFTSFFADGSFFYFPNSGFVGTDTFSYRTVAGDGRKSAPATVTVNVLPPQTPVAEDDFFSDQATGTSTQYTFNGQSVLDNDTDPQFDLLAAKILTQPSTGLVALDGDGTLSLLTPAGFSGQVSFTYQATDGSYKSKPATATLQIMPPAVNFAPIVEVRPGGSVSATGLGGTMNLFIADGQTAADALRIAKSSSNTALVPAANVTLGGTGSQRTVTITPVAGTSGTATVTVRVTDSGGLSKTLTITVKVGGSAINTLTGTAGADMLFGLGGDDTLNGLAGNDVIGGGSGNDTMTGGTGADVFRGGTGTNTATDFNTAQGDTKLEIA